ncbi:MAG: CorA family divalent cation transporter, partial [Elusimicrobiota bacterium]|nr:CorA family divalent cation transporter [Elusimicrobiota bacterium]
MSNHRFFQVSPGGELQPKQSAEEALGIPPGGGYAWLDFRSPSREDLTPLVGLLGIHQLSVDDCLDENHIPKIDNFGKSTFLLINSYSHRDGVLAAGEIDFIIGANFLVTAGGRGKTAHWEDRDIERVLRLDRANLGQGPDFLLHALVNHVIDGKHNAINSLESEVDEAEESIVKDLSNFRMSRLVHLRKNILVMRKSLFHEREVLIKLCRRDSPFVGEKAIYHFRDLYDHLTKYYEEAEIYREVILSLTEMYLSMVNNHMSQ